MVSTHDVWQSCVECVRGSAHRAHLARKTALFTHCKSVAAVTAAAALKAVPIGAKSVPSWAHGALGQ